MIQANELRIGSKVAAGVHICTVNSIHTVPQTNECFVRVDGFLEHNSQYQFELYQLQPIPLTPEILESCGATKFEGEDIMTFWKVPICKEVQLDWHDDSSILAGDWTGVNTKVFSIEHIKYLHQLQNLYFALTGKELEVNLTAKTVPA